MIGWLVRKWCEWCHVHSWKGTGLVKPGSYTVFMECKKCGRKWQTIEE